MPKSICNKIADPVKRKRCLERVRSEQSEAPSGDEAVKRISKKGSKKIKSGRY